MNDDSSQANGIDNLEFSPYRTEAEKEADRLADEAAMAETLADSAEEPVTDESPAIEVPPPARKPVRRTRRARLRIARVDPWSVMKVSFLFSIAFGIMFWVSVFVLWNVIESSGMFETVNDTVNNVLGTGETNFALEQYINANRVLGFSALLAVVDVVLFTAIATLFSFLYNLAATVLGGLEVTLAEDSADSR